MTNDVTTDGGESRQWPMEVTFEYTMDEWLVATELSVKKQSWLRGWGTRFDLALTLIFAVNAVLMAIGRLTFSWWNMAFDCFIVGTTAWDYFTFKPGIRRNLLKAFRKYPEIEGERRVSLTPSQIYYSSTEWTRRIYWSQVQEIVEQPTHILFVSQVEPTVIIPKQAFTNPPAVREFYEMAKGFWQRSHSIKQNA